MASITPAGNVGESGEGTSIAVSEVPIVICNRTTVLRNPSPSQLADGFGLNDNIDTSRLHDLIIVGAGPAGLSAAVYAAFEGLDILLIESHTPAAGRMPVRG
ncbi:NAD(P)-binding protein [Acidicapsa acidisoli]|uniref:NAD(P)-binding protein n=1 Tax=Acidicapsa acidisoli TaxID=1615681 RepID=UPI0021DFCF68|nr:NAD(P)-binding protein [Acidicapsa acidisoli]